MAASSLTHAAQATQPAANLTVSLVRAVPHESLCQSHAPHRLCRNCLHRNPLAASGDDERGNRRLTYANRF
jgi:hypothetical protein